MRIKTGNILKYSKNSQIKMKIMNKIGYQVQIALRNFKPKIWRRLIVDPETSLEDFHRIIQTAMGWTNSHLHQFIKDKKFYSLPSEDDWGDSYSIDYRPFKIKDFLIKEKDRMVYEYDFGDGWEHDIILEKQILLDNDLIYPICTKAVLACPPDDCGGVWGYSNLLTILADPKHKEHEEMKEWIGEYFDPDFVDLEEINDNLQEENYGCFEFDF